jgi:hypothetical protein
MEACSSDWGQPGNTAQGSQPGTFCLLPLNGHAPALPARLSYRRFIFLLSSASTLGVWVLSLLSQPQAITMLVQA